MRRCIPVFFLREALLARSSGPEHDIFHHYGPGLYRLLQSLQIHSHPRHVLGDWLLMAKYAFYR